MQYCFPMESSCSELLLLLLIDSSENQSMKGGGVKKGMGHYYCKHQMLMEFLTN